MNLALSDQVPYQCLARQLLASKPLSEEEFFRKTGYLKLPLVQGTAFSVKEVFLLKHE